MLYTSRSPSPYFIELDCKLKTMQFNFKYVKISKNGGQLHVLSNLADRCHVLSSTCLVMFNVLIKNENPNIVGPGVIW